MEIKVCKNTGYCKGVEHAVALAKKALALAEGQGRPAYCIGSLVHNGITRKWFEDRGMRFVRSPEGLEPGVAVVSAHGCPESVVRSFREAGFTVLDGTCRNVLENKNQILKRAQMGCLSVIVGIPGHSEVLCLAGVELFPGVPVMSFVVSREEDVDLIPAGFPLFVIAQTTIDGDFYGRIVNLIKSRFDDVVVRRSLCASPISRQMQAIELSAKCDAMVIVGGAGSANTSVLAKVVADNGIKVFKVECASEIPQEVYRYERVGVASGASTPQEEVEKVVKELESHVQSV